MVDDAAWELLRLHDLWPGCLPYPGGLYQQPAVYVQAMRLITEARKRLEQEIARDAQNHGNR